MTNSDPMNPTYPPRVPQSGESQTLTDQVSQKASDAASKVSDAASQAKNKVGELSQNAVNKLDSARESTAGALQTAASSLRNSAQSGGDMLSNAAHAVSTKLETTANYMRENQVRDMVTDVEQVVRRNPGPSIVAALAVGFLLGSALRRD